MVFIAHKYSLILAVDNFESLKKNSNLTLRTLTTVTGIALYFTNCSVGTKQFLADKCGSIQFLCSRHALSSIASSTACEGECESLGSVAGAAGLALRGARSLDALATPRLRRHHTTRSLDADQPVATVCGDPLFNGTIIGIVTDDVPRRQAETSPLLRKCSLYNKLDRPRRKVHDASYIEFYKRWRSLENVADTKGERKLPRFAIRSWLLGFFGGAPRGSSASLRRAPPLLDRESAV